MDDSDDNLDLLEVELLETRIGYQGFFRIDVHRLRHRRFDGSVTDEMVREIFERGHAAAVLPYDPGRDEVLLIRQFLPGAYFGGGLPRPLQIIAGMIEEGESGEDVARREAVEEAGVRIGRMELAHAFLPSPGGSSERVTVYCAQADLSEAGGIHGLAAEHEDIRVEVYPARDAIALLDDGRIEAGPAVVALSWFARHHERLKRDWLNAERPGASREDLP
jgi:ADP-ribose diphosphatase